MDYAFEGLYLLETDRSETTVHRRRYAPGDDISGVPADVQAEAAALWTPDAIDALRAAEAAAEAASPFRRPRPLTADSVRAEAQRRIIAMVGARDIMHCLIKQHNAQMRATELTLKKAENIALTAEEEAEAAMLQGIADTIKAIRAASNVLEVMDPTPADYADDKHWP